MSTTDLTNNEQATLTPSATRPAGGEGPNWQEQDSVLRDMWMRNQPPAAIAKELNRSVPAIMTRAARLGLPRRFAPGRKPGRRALDSSTPRHETTRAAAPPTAIDANIASQVASRICLMCLTKFQSQGRHNRICPSCKNSAEFESGSRLPDLDFSSGDR